MADVNAVESAFELLRAHRARLAEVSMLHLFEEDPGRFNKLSARLGELLLDYSKNRIDSAAMRALVELAAAADVAGRRDDMFGGKAVNTTEGRAALHVALRAADGDAYFIDGRDVVPEARERPLQRLAEEVRSGKIAGAKGAKFTDVVNIGIGGSDLGPKMATLALRPYHDGPRVHFLSNVEGSHAADTLAGLNPETTLFLIASKTFTTIETMTNAQTARAWLAGRLGEAAVPAHFAAMSTATDLARKFGVMPERVFPFADWVGGRYSAWSSIGLPLMIAIGEKNFRAFLSGGRAMDLHFRDAPLAENLPVILALIGIWYRNFWDCASLAILPYDQRMEHFPPYLQQLDMESNGKRVHLDGSPVRRQTGAVVWGGTGTNAQHAFFQLLHQGTDMIPCDFLAAIESHDGLPVHQALTLANCLAQTEALMRGRTVEEAEAELVAQGLSQSDAAALAPHRVFPGNRPSNTLLYRRLDPQTLGMLMALYEHKVFVQAVIWDVNPFDQWGVELGKVLARELLPMVEGKKPADGRDASTAGLVAEIRRGAK